MHYIQFVSVKGTESIKTPFQFQIGLLSLTQTCRQVSRPFAVVATLHFAFTEQVEARLALVQH